MSRYTTELRYICESLAGLTSSQGFKSVDSIIKKALPFIFDFDFPIFDESYRVPLELKIIRHYYTREISEETFGLWKLRLESRLNEIMPYYNKLYLSETLNFNPLYDTDITTSFDKDFKGVNKVVSNQANTSTVNSTGSISDVVSVDNTQQTATTNKNNDTETTQNKNWDLYSDTPQGGITGLENNEYLTNARKNNGDSTAKREQKAEFSGTVGNTGTTQTTNNSSNSTDSQTALNSTNDTDITNTESYIQKVQGKSSSGSFSKMISEYRETLLNIDMQIINNLSDLFFLLWE